MGASTQLVVQVHAPAFEFVQLACAIPAHTFALVMQASPATLAVQSDKYVLQLAVTSPHVLSKHVVLFPVHVESTPEQLVKS